MAFSVEIYLFNKSEQDRASQCVAEETNLLEKGYYFYNEGTMRHPETGDTVPSPIWPEDKEVGYVYRAYTLKDLAVKYATRGWFCKPKSLIYENIRPLVFVDSKGLKEILKDLVEEIVNETYVGTDVYASVSLICNTLEMMNEEPEEQMARISWG